jgi:sporulation protein YlmC with PRC-barrel domain
MLRNVKDLRGYAIRATDGVIGHVDDFYFDDEAWAIRYLVVETGRWLPDRQVLISPISIGHPDWSAQLLPVSLTKAQVKASPDIDTKQPVSRQHEAMYHRYFGYPFYWGGGGIWGMGAYPGSLTAEDAIEAEMMPTRSATIRMPADYHLRSCRDLVGHHIAASDGEIGHVQDLLVDDHTWAIRYLIVNTSQWWGEHQVLIAPPWIESVNSEDQKVKVLLSRDSVKGAPVYDPAAQLDREQEQAMYEHYGRPGYWTAQEIREEQLAASSAKDN